MENLKLIISDFIKIKECFFWIQYYSHLEMDNKIVFYKRQIAEIYKKYSVNDYIDIIELIKNTFYHSEMKKDAEFCKNIIFSINIVKRLTLMQYDDSIFKEIYKYLINNNIYNPNWNIGVSGEPLYTLLPVVPELFEANMLVYKNENIDWQILNNGSDSFMGFVYLYLNASNDMYKDYYFEILQTALDTTCDLESIIRYKSESKKVRYQKESIKSQLLKVDDYRINGLLKSYYCKSKKLINN